VRGGDGLTDAAVAAMAALTLWRGLGGAPAPPAGDAPGGERADRLTPTEPAAAHLAHASGPVGAPCLRDDDCTTGRCAVEARAASGVTWRGGYCTELCDAASPCPAGATCVALADGSGRCAAACNEALDCRAGYVCARAVGACLPDCRLGWDCGDRLRCDAATGACAPPHREVGEPCVVDADCASGRCLAEHPTRRGRAWRGGSCTERCRHGRDCPDGAACVALADGQSLCVRACEEAGDCRPGYVCSPAVRACLPDCREGWSCGKLRCDGATGFCR